MKREAIVLLCTLLAGCEASPGASRRNLVDQGYLLGSADAIKQLYWAKQALEAPRPTPDGRTEYYTWEDSGTYRDGRRLAPESVAVPIFVPAPAPSGAPVP